MIKSRRTRRILLAVFLIAASLFLLRDQILLSVGDYLVVEDTLQTADLIHVIAGEDYRTDYAIQLYHKGYAPRIFFTGGWCTIHNLYHGQHGKDRAMEQSVPAAAILTDDSHVISTYEEVVRLKELIAHLQTPVHSVIVVSDPYHMRRARWTYHEVLGDGVRIEMAPVPFGSTPEKKRWWSDRKSRRMVEDEYLKMVYYYARYRLSFGPVKRWLESLDQS